MKKISKFHYVELYVFCHDYHSGQASKGYRLLSRLNVRNLSSEAMEGARETEIYKFLVSKYANEV